MQALLKAFDNDPEKLANTFTEQLNAQLTIKRKEEELNKKAATVMNDWNDYVKSYFEFHKIDLVKIPDYLFTEPEDIESILKLVLETYPEVEKYLNTLNKIAEMSSQEIQKLKGTVKPITQNISETFSTNYNVDVDEFKKSIKRFFDKNGI